MNANKRTTKKRSIATRIGGWIFALIFVVTSIGAGAFTLHQSAQEVYAKDIGSKNEIAKQACDGTTPPSWQDIKNSNDENSPSAADRYTPVPGTTGEYYYKHPTDSGTGAEIKGVWTSQVHICV